MNEYGFVVRAGALSKASFYGHSAALVCMRDRVKVSNSSLVGYANVTTSYREETTSGTNAW